MASKKHRKKRKPRKGVLAQALSKDKRILGRKGKKYSFVPKERGYLV